MRFHSSPMWIAAAASLSLSACVTYLTPGAGAPMSTLTTAASGDMHKLAPSLQLPARIAFVRVQAAGYRSFGTEGFGDGNCSVILAHEVETADDLSSMSQWPQVLGVEAISRLLLPSDLHGFSDLRDAAAAAQTDVLFAYTFDTVFHVGNRAYKPEELITLGVLPGREASVSSTAAGVFVDVRQGSILGTAEGSDVERTLMTKWTKPSSADETRLKAERAAFAVMIDDAHRSWGAIVSHNAPLTTFNAPGADSPVVSPESAPPMDGRSGAGGGSQ